MEDVKEETKLVDVKVEFTSVKEKSKARRKTKTALLVTNSKTKSDIQIQKKVGRPKKPPRIREKCKCENDNRKWQDFPGLQGVLPENYEYKVCEWTKLTNGFNTTLRMATIEPETMEKWKIEFEEKTKTTYRTSRTFPNIGAKLLFKGMFHCQHGKPNKMPGKSKKNTDCQSSLELMIKRNTAERSRSLDPHIEDRPVLIKCVWLHNHTLNSSEFLKFRDVSEKARAQLLALFEQGHTVGSGLKAYKDKLKLDQEISGCEVVADDRYMMPDYNYAWRLHQSLKKDKGIKNRKYTKRVPGSPPKRVRRKPVKPKETKQAQEDNQEEEMDLQDNTITTEIAIAELERVCKQIMDKTRQNPALLLPAVESFSTSLNHLIEHGCDSDLASALSSFQGNTQSNMQNNQKERELNSRELNSRELSSRELNSCQFAQNNPLTSGNILSSSSQFSFQSHLSSHNQMFSYHQPSSVFPQPIALNKQYSTYNQHASFPETIMYPKL